MRPFNEAQQPAMSFFFNLMSREPVKSPVAAEKNFRLIFMDTLILKGFSGCE
jgi:hypothetical protein